MVLDMQTAAGRYGLPCHPDQGCGGGPAAPDPLTPMTSTWPSPCHKASRFYPVPLRLASDQCIALLNFGKCILESLTLTLVVASLGPAFRVP